MPPATASRSTTTTWATPRRRSSSAAASPAGPAPDDQASGPALVGRSEQLGTSAPQKKPDSARAALGCGAAHRRATAGGVRRGASRISPRVTRSQ